MENLKKFTSEYLKKKTQNKLKLPIVTIANATKQTLKSYFKIGSACPPQNPNKQFHTDSVMET